ncbi:hypothetical protein [Luedemannella helvata]|uniref:VWFA domain-containing protein n=1 Tax=Luedemannella helvata TaxID=349315 RepID=A0ABN2KX89_9ACTN
MAQPVPNKTAWDLTTAAIMPGGGIAKRPLHFIIAADCSWSMHGEKMQALNYAIATMLPRLAEWERAQENAQVLVRALRFDNRASWHIEEPTPVGKVRWTPLRCEERALTHMGAALRLMASVLTVDQMERRALRPALILITDGIATDNFETGLAELLATPGGAAAIRVAVAIGQDARPQQLAKFSDENVGVLHASNAEDIPDLLMAVSVAVSRMSEVGADKANLTQQLRQHGYDPTDDSIV